MVRLDVGAGVESERQSGYAKVQRRWVRELWQGQVRRGSGAEARALVGSCFLSCSPPSLPHPPPPFPSACFSPSLFHPLSLR